ncbi:hypothetical protein PILCRDRAFT_14669 [Piloderma croceum F 1598]|uniref:Uncharacterized protein n=1 Tax=Piloderma croceum (strain F 1598) TaxID=765440 RepID=A0A0C3F2J1_PILCF|nr:hypothetical protein PILCRDRAFT_14669 [Piloderma croceum F 1598]
MSEAKLIGFQILAGIGVALGMQNSLFAIHWAVLFSSDCTSLTASTSIGSFGQFLKGCVAEPVFTSELSKFILKYAPNVPAAFIKKLPTAIDIPADQIPGVVLAYAESLKIVFLVGVPIARLGLLASF